MSLQSCTLTSMAMGISKKYLVVEFKHGLALPKRYTLIKTMWNHNNTGDKRTVQEVFIST